ncbi:MerR family transcriptional regulator [Phytopseudomonas dryadis]|uniref:Helix-turn-helix-type transcriptional regulator n=1 Tax=Phytopseudomonas dryadis TaxID=2487520 RepID=A0A4Q9QY06_9GAMM|nr:MULTISPECIES: MerR family transcriptional regulator [Pseudomonas]TBU89743.1 helix-turn-helix-type transcriptional regulator [Pseudomonas dryadis]TBV05986.1 helix-turn-helix-type transcriptional regulator [Pseudomonas dryadis]TBV18127.1 helix-turn-helix-type transcriptional regulator [Pseudomonas sp. FRB 230]
MSDLVDTQAFVSSVLKQQELFPIREVARLTGVNPVTLRAWERRYGLIQPIRTDSGHRLYSQVDVETVRSVLAWIERGVPVSKVGKILARSSMAQVTSAPVYEAATSVEWAQWQSRVHEAIQAFDEAELDRVYGQVFSSYPLSVAFQDILMPLWQTLLLRQDQRGRSSEWLFFDTFLRGRVLQRLHNLRDQPGGRLLLVALPGRCRELELLVSGLLLNPGEVVIHVLGIGQSLEELPLVCAKMRPLAVVVFSNQAPNDDTPKALERLALTLECPLVMAGEGADLLQESLRGSPIACLGSEGRLMQRRLRQFLAGHLDT